MENKAFISYDKQWSYLLKIGLLESRVFWRFFRQAMKQPIENTQCMIQVIMLHADSSWLSHFRSELSNRSTRKCLHEDETWIPRISFVSPSNGSNTTTLTERDLKASNKLFFLFFLNDLNCYYHVSLL